MIFEWQLLLLILTSSGFLAYFLYRPLKLNIAYDDSNVAIARQKKQELIDDLKKGLISDSLYQEAEDEITHTLASELNQESDTVVEINPLKWAVTLGIIIAVLSLLIYSQLAPQKQSNTSLDIPSSLTLEQSVQRLENYLLDNPEDGESWKVLGLATFNLGNIDKSIASFEKAFALIPNDVDMLLQYAIVLASTRGGNFSGEPQSYIEKALEIDPNSSNAFYLQGIVAVNNNFGLAEQYWQKALYLLPAEHLDRDIIENALNVLLNSKLVDDYSLAINVSISQDILSSRSESDYLMVYARAITGSPMPIAIKKIRLKYFSGNLSLSDADSLSLKLSESKEVVIVVRISSSGMAVKQEGDIEVLSDTISLVDTSVVDLQVE